MRLLLSALAIIVGFGVGAWVIARLIAESTPAWVGVSLAMVWLFVLILGALLLSGNQRKKRNDKRRLLGYGLLAAVLMAAFLIPVFVYHVNVPKVAAEAVLAAIGVAVFLFSEWMQRRDNRRADA